MGTEVTSILAGAPAVNFAWHGALSLDDLTLAADAPPPNRLVVAGPVHAGRGRCTAFTLRTRPTISPLMTATY